MKKMTFFAVFIFAIQSYTVYACDIDGKTGFMPENNMSILVGDKNANTMTEEKFNAIITKIEDVYAPIIRSKKGKLVVNRKWTDGTVNASASRSGSTWNVNMFGGLARHKDVTDDGFALVVCHELGHHLGGAPKVGGFFMKWASNEGQSDYFASLKCMRRVYGNDDNIALMSKIDVPQYAVDQCKQAWDREDEQALCMRVAMAGKSLAKLLGRGAATSFSTPDTRVVSRTYNKHPKGQCRLDTYFQGGLCDKEISDEVSNRDRTKGVCTRAANHEQGVRPLCWYKP